MASGRSASHEVLRKAILQNMSQSESFATGSSSPMRSAAASGADPDAELGSANPSLELGGGLFSNDVPTGYVGGSLFGTEEPSFAYAETPEGCTKCPRTPSPPAKTKEPEEIPQVASAVPPERPQDDVQGTFPESDVENTPCKKKKDKKETSKVEKVKKRPAAAVETEDGDDVPVMKRPAIKRPAAALPEPHGDAPGREDVAQDDGADGASPEASKSKKWCTTAERSYKDKNGEWEARFISEPKFNFFHHYCILN